MAAMKPIYLTAPLQLAEQDGEDLPRTFSGEAYSGGLIPGYYGDRGLVVDLSSARMGKSMPLLLEHERDRTIGLINGIESGNSLKVSGDLYSDIDDNAKTVAMKAKRGLPYQMSIGVFDASVENVPAGKSVVVNGRTFSGPVTVLRQGHIRETSIVTLGADPETSVAMLSQQERNMELEQALARITQLEADVAALTSERDTAAASLAAANDKLEAIELAAKTDLVKQYFSAVGKDATEEATKQYLAFGADQLKIMLADATELKSRAPEHLFRETATGAPEKRQGALLAAVKTAHGIK